MGCMDRGEGQRPGKGGGGCILGRGRGGGEEVGAYPSDQGVGSLGAIGGHDGAEVLVHQGPYEHYAIPVAQGHCYQQLQTHLQPGLHCEYDGIMSIVVIMEFPLPQSCVHYSSMYGRGHMYTVIVSVSMPGTCLAVMCSTRFCCCEDT